MNIVAFDMDDTLLRDDLTISEYTINVLHEMHRRSWTIVPASGRAQKSILPFVEKIGTVDYYISCNGAEVWKKDGHRLLNRECFSTEVGKRIAAFGKKHSCYSQTYEGDYFFYSEQSRWASMYAASSMLQGKYVGDLELYINEPRSKILMMAEPDRIAGMLTEARLLFANDASVTCSKPYFLEFNPLKATKGNALVFLSGLLGTDLSTSVSFGDSLNDLSMLTACATGVAMKNARPEVLAACREHCGSNNEDGVAEYLASHFLKENKA